ncbi:MAG: adenylate/guanylate cyclase domain-containing protein, partial [Saprospiraceae bacterium]
MTDHAEFRRLAAVMFTDLEGYTTMFHKNETTALANIKLHRQYLEEITNKHHGHIIRFYGDGSLVLYDSVIDAVHSAIEIQHVSRENKIPVRIGIHVGEVIHRGDDIFGDAVNIASRIQSIGIPGSVVISKKVADEINNHPEIDILKLGEYSLKNVSENIELYALKGSGLTTPGKQSLTQRKPVMMLYALIALMVVAGIVLFFYPDLLSSSRYKILDRRIIIPPFENLTLRPEYDQVGEIASSMITYDLSTTSDADVVSNASILRFTNAD